jgi:hypothetical protein
MAYTVGELLAMANSVDPVDTAISEDYFYANFSMFTADEQRRLIAAFKSAKVRENNAADLLEVRKYYSDKSPRSV